VQHGVWIDAAVQSASVSVDEFLVSGWGDHFVVDGESVILGQARRSVVPERLADALLEEREVVMDAAGEFH
jgi:hypothetical protein